MMLTLLGSNYRKCDGITRRGLLRIGALGFGGLNLPDLLRQNALAAEQHRNVPDTAVIQIFLGGGPSHLDMFDMKPRAPLEIRGEFIEIPTNIPGTRICEHLPLLATMADKFSVVRSVCHSNPSHLPSSHWLQTGYEGPSTSVTGQNVRPSIGAITARLRGSNSPGMPAYAAIPRGQAFAYPAYLGSAYGPFTTDIEPNDDNFQVRNLRLGFGLSEDRLSGRGSLLNRLDSLKREMDQRGDMAGIDRFHRQAMEIVTSQRAADAFDIQREPPRVRESYGRTSIGQNCLLARRLVEAGVTFVTCLSGGGWDTHADNFKQMKISLPRLDRAVSALLTDLCERGLDKRVLVHVMGEFGRTPRINGDAGRDHWPHAMFAMFAGGGMAMGRMIGTTDGHAAFPTSRPNSPESVLATIYHVLGIDPTHVFPDFNGRPVPVLGSSEIIPELSGSSRFAPSKTAVQPKVA
jgi:hypothetical protein